LVLMPVSSWAESSVREQDTRNIVQVNKQVIERPKDLNVFIMGTLDN
jgi:hypothetical protein